MEDCPAGTYSTASGATSQLDCIPCPEGLVCASDGISVLPVANCDAGYFCGGGAEAATQTPCSAGYKCEQGTRAEIRCEAGYYQDETQQDTCKDCPAGSYCDGEDPTATQ
mmetsp:Transcript_50620/g.69372  ORF Transcript_50620/g.69372 Transcript_50620/m.69372 type:complete len:110 (+) Transcript_50620:1502-1831(+)